MLAPFIATPTLTSLKDILVSHQEKIKEIKSRFVTAQNFENATRIQEVNKAISHLLSTIDLALID